MMALLWRRLLCPLGWHRWRWVESPTWRGCRCAACGDEVDLGHEDWRVVQ